MPSLHIRQRVTNVFKYRLTNITMLKQHEHPYLADRIKQNQEHIWRLQKRISDLERLECRIQSLTDKHQNLEKTVWKIIPSVEKLIPLIKTNNDNSVGNDDEITNLKNRITELESACSIISVFFPFYGRPPTKFDHDNKDNPISNFTV